MQSIYFTHDPQETERIAADFSRSLHPGDVVALYGGLGMGKTTFVRGMAQGLGSVSEVSSPTFALVHEYEARIPIVHFDMYRIRSMDDLYSTGFFDYLESGSILVIEWTENIAQYLPERVHTVRISRGGSDNERQLMIDDARAGD